ncbi:MAG: DNA-binding protein [Verrucomicrobiaceae bacterium]|nr:MAG: DNA-binding protein [Verrucomicrobiaceae bacterium]
MTKPTSPITTALPAYLDREQLATRWDCSVSTLKRREKAGELIPTRFGPRIVRYSVVQILAIEKAGAMGV